MNPFRRTARHRPVAQREAQYGRRQVAAAEAKARQERERFRYVYLR